jgi:hypothetical protein
MGEGRQDRRTCNHMDGFMLTHEQSELITRTGPATPMGDFLRRYWIPILQAEELPENECPPVRVKLLWLNRGEQSEDLLAWRDSRGRCTLIDEFCAHRGVSLWFGRNEENGLRCPITAGNTIGPGSAWRCRQSRRKAASARGSS